MGEGPESQNIRKRAIKFLQCSEAIYFLGFGYSRFNLRQIDFGDDMGGQEIMGTHFPIEAKIPDRFMDGDNNGFRRRIKISRSTIDEFLHSHANVIHFDSFPPRTAEFGGWDSSMSFEEVVSRLCNIRG